MTKNLTIMIIFCNLATLVATNFVRMRLDWHYLSYCIYCSEKQIAITFLNS